MHRAHTQRDRILIASCLVLVCALAWAYLVRLGVHAPSAGAAGGAMAGMAMPAAASWQPADFALTFTMWAVMMVGMMGPAAAPMLLLLAALPARRAEHGTSAVVPPFALGYLTVWLGFSACATLAQWALHRAALLSSAMAIASPRVAGALLVAAGLYQFTPLKNACLTHCQTPVGFLMSHWRAGAAGAFQMGLHHGIHCLGCCWALMAVLFAVGVMNLAWVAVLTVVILAERISSGGAVLSRIGGVALVGLGVALITSRGA